MLKEGACKATDSASLSHLPTSHPLHTPSSHLLFTPLLTPVVDVGDKESVSQTVALEARVNCHFVVA